MKRVLCFGDSNTYGFDGREMAVTGDFSRFDEETRWTHLLGNMLGNGWCVYEAGMGGRTTVFDDPLEYGRNGLKALDVVFKSNEPVDLVTIMLGTNDLKDMFNASAEVISWGMEQLIQRLQDLIARSRNPQTKILIIAPANVSATSAGSYMYGFSEHSVAKGRELPRLYAALAQKYGCSFWDASRHVSVDPSDGTHLNPQGHRLFAESLLPVIQSILGAD